MYPLGLSQPYPLNQWWLGAYSHEVKREILGRTILGRPVVFYRTEAGNPVAMAGLCPHRHFPMTKGRLAGDALQCGYHGFTFAPSGQCVAIPSQENAPGQFIIRNYPLVERSGAVWIWTGDVAAANPALLPDLEALGMGAPGWAMEQHPPARLNGRYQLLIDNLLDLSHISYIHETTIPGGGKVVFIPPETIETERSFNIAREGKSLPPNPMTRKLFPDYDGPTDQHFDAEYLGPNLIRTGGLISASAAIEDEASTRLGVTNFLHAITPETPTSTHYFVMTTRDFRLDDPAIGAMNLHMGAAIQPQDKEAIEAIEATLDTFADVGSELSCVADTGAIRVRRRLAAQIRAELAGATNS